jgi:hypothetical protein
VLRTSVTALMAILVALTVSLGLLLVSVPNVELITFSAFASGALLGRWRGAVTGALAMAIYSAINPVGSGLAVPSLYAAQVCAVAIVGLVGGATGRIWLSARTVPSTAAPASPSGPAPPRGTRAGRVGIHLSAAAVGLALTGLYQAAVILGLAVVSPRFRTGFSAVMISNALFSAVHMASNTLVFGFLVPTVLPRMNRIIRGAAGS